jgi:hypothetical protein
MVTVSRSTLVVLTILDVPQILGFISTVMFGAPGSEVSLLES